MRGLLSFIIMIVLFIPVISRASDEPVFGTYFDGQEKITLKDIELFKRIFQNADRRMTKYVFPLKGNTAEKDCFERITAEADMAGIFKKLYPEPKIEFKEGLNKLRELFLEDLFQKKMWEQCNDISEEEIRTNYEKNKNKYQIAKRINFRMIF